MKINSQSNYWEVTIILFGCFLLISSHDNKNIDEKYNNCDIDHQVISLDLQPNQNIRNLQNDSSVHGIRMHGVFTDTTVDNILVFKKVYAIATNYFQKAIKVTSILTHQQTKYPNTTSSCLGYNILQNYKVNGFDQTLMDTVIFITMTNNVSSSNVAFGGACLLARWPIYGVLGFNIAHFQANFTKTGLFHSNIYTTMHQLTHVLGFSRSLFNLYYASYTSTTRLNIIQVKNTIEINNSTFREVIVSPNVQKYIQTFFECSSGTIGALLEDEGGTGSAGSHWERKVFMDQMMTASVRLEGNKISALTLNILKDTGYYYDVDINLSEQVLYGAKKGCAFAMGQVSDPPEFCTSSSDISLCDFYGFYGGSCRKSDPFGDQSFTITPFSNMFCNLPQYQTINPLPMGKFDSLSRCFNNQNSSGLPQCYNAKCINNSAIQIKVNGQKALCLSNSSVVSINNSTIKCPDNFEIFCSRQNCNDWCSTFGLCLKGVCLQLNCNWIDFNCVSCQYGLCFQCSNNLYPTINQLQCSQCSSIYSNCEQCSNNGVNTACLRCKQGYVWKYSQTRCKICMSELSYCLSCSINSPQVISCIQCIDTFIIINGLCACQQSTKLVNGQCISCNINYCLECSSNNFCGKCKDGFYQNNGNCTCLTTQYLDTSQGLCIRNKQLNLTIILCATIIPSLLLSISFIIIVLAIYIIKVYICRNDTPRLQESNIADSSIKNLNYSSEIDRKRKNSNETMKYSKDDQLKKYPHLECKVCLGNYVTHQGTCRHFYHYECIQEWIKNNHSCPQCLKPATIENIIKLDVQGQVIRYP